MKDFLTEVSALQLQKKQYTSTISFFCSRSKHKYILKHCMHEVVYLDYVLE